MAADAAEAAKVAKHEAAIPQQRTSDRYSRERSSRDGGQDTKPGESASPGQQRQVTQICTASTVQHRQRLDTPPFCSAKVPFLCQMSPVTNVFLGNTED